MTPARWRQIEELYHSVRECEPGARSAHLAQACAGDEALQRSVEVLLAQEESGAGILDHPPAGLMLDPTVTQVAVGAQLGPYRVEGLLGAGGMGEVYRGRDTRLDRAVAIKFSQERFGGRFQREARAISALNHPRICTLYDIGPNYLVMELVEGETLAARLQKGALPVAAALSCAIEIADALAAAHAKGIVHRDLKPANIMVNKSGIKVLDFGLAKSPQDEALTASRAVLGTPAYMAPEQLAGTPSDARADIYAFGLVLYEMLTCRRLPPNEAPAAAGIAAPVAHVLLRCLARDPAERWQAASDVKLELEWARREQLPVVSRRSWQTLPWWVAGVLAAIAALAFWMPRRVAPSAADKRFLQLELETGAAEFSQLAISPDGTRIALASKGALATRRLDQLKSAPVSGTDGAALPFFSPNGQWIAFFAGRKLQKIPVEGGVPVTLCEAPDAGGGAWEDDDHIVAALEDGQGLARVPAAGGTPQSMMDSKADRQSALWPQSLPGGKGVLFAAVNGSMQGSLRILPPNHGPIKTIVENSTYGRYLDGGYLVYYQGGALFAAPMDLARLELTGPSVPLVTGVSNLGWGRADFDLSPYGTLIYRGRTAEAAFSLSWLYPSGKDQPVLAKLGSYATPRLSPDGHRVALSVIQDGRQNIWVYDFSRETLSRLTSEAGPDLLPTWTPDGEFVAFRSGNALAWTRSDGSGAVERLAWDSPNAGPYSFSADGRWLTLWPLQPGSDLWVARVERSPGSLKLGPPQLLRKAGSTPSGGLGAPAISPDDRWLAYATAETGRFEVYVVPFSPQGGTAGGKWQVSSAGGWSPKWSRDSRELFYYGLDRRVWTVSYAAGGDSFTAGKARPWSDTRLGELFPGFDVSSDGKRVMAVIDAGEATPQLFLHVLLNLDSELHRRFAGRGK